MRDVLMNDVLAYLNECEADELVNFADAFTDGSRPTFLFRDSSTTHRDIERLTGSPDSRPN